MLPNLDPYLRLLEPEMQLEKQKNEVKRHEAWLVYGALMVRSALLVTSPQFYFKFDCFEEQMHKKKKFSSFAIA